VAGDWIKMRNDLASDPAVIGIAAKLGIDEYAVVGRLHSIWAWADEQSRDGHAPGVTLSWLDRAFHADGFAKAMIDVGWLKQERAGISFPNFDRHNGATAKTRALSNKRKQSQRAKDVPETSRTERDKSVTREEKRREDIKEPPKSPKGGLNGVHFQPLPAWLPATAWQDFCDHRRLEKKPQEAWCQTE
jgi:hypothetical protein